MLNQNQVYNKTKRNASIFNLYTKLVYIVYIEVNSPNLISERRDVQLHIKTERQRTLVLKAVRINSTTEGHLTSGLRKRLLET